MLLLELSKKFLAHLYEYIKQLPPGCLELKVFVFRALILQKWTGRNLIKNTKYGQMECVWFFSDVVKQKWKLPWRTSRGDGEQSPIREGGLIARTFHRNSSKNIATPTIPRSESRIRRPWNTDSSMKFFLSRLSMLWFSRTGYWCYAIKMYTKIGSTFSILQLFPGALWQSSYPQGREASLWPIGTVSLRLCEPTTLFWLGAEPKKKGFWLVERNGGWRNTVV